MRTKYLLVIVALVFFGCQLTEKKKTIFGSWTADELPKYANDGVFDRLVFSEPDSFKLYLIWTGYMTDTLIGRFQFNPDDSMLIMTYDTMKIKSKIIEWDTRKLVIQSLDSGHLMKYKKTGN